MSDPWKRKEVIGDATLYLGDCLEILPTLSKVDAVITDPPYLLNDTTGSCTGSAKSESWRGLIRAGDKSAGIVQISWESWANKLPLCNVAHIFVFANDKNLHKAMNAFDSNLQLHNVLVWKKNNCTPSRWFMKNGEFILFYRKGPAVPIKHLNSKTVVDFESVENKTHPTEKPIKLLEYLSKNALGTSTLDPFMGSGTTGVACMNLGRKFVGIEIEPKYFDIACRRIEDVQRQQRMFA